MSTSGELVAKIKRITDWNGLRGLWTELKSGTPVGWEPGEALEYLVIRAFGLDPEEPATVRYPYEVSLFGEKVEEIDGAVHFVGAGHPAGLAREAERAAVAPGRGDVADLEEERAVLGVEKVDAADGDGADGVAVIGVGEREVEGAAGFGRGLLLVELEGDLDGGFDGGGIFRGHGGAGDGTLSTGAVNCKGQPLGPGETVQAKQIYDYLTSQYQLSPEVASGILGNMMTESSMRTNANNCAEGAIGLCQWEGPRRTALEHFAEAQGKPVTDWHVQVDFMMHELKGSESGALDRLQHAGTAQQAAAVFDRYFERSAGTSRGQRMANAENIYQRVANPAVS